MLLHFDNELSIVIGGEAGQGIQAIEQIIGRAGKRAGFFVFSTGEFMSRIRGGSNSTQIRLSSNPCNSYIERIDICIPLDSDSIPHLGKRISPQTIIFADPLTNTAAMPAIRVPFSAMATEAGGKIFANSVAAGFIAGLLGISLESVSDIVTSHFHAKDPAITAKNSAAVNKGHAAAEAIKKTKNISINLAAGNVHNQILMRGSDIAGIGAIAGGCNFVASYPMSPSSDVLAYLARNARDSGIVVEQAEDEIAALNMVLGAWYAGGRGLVTTSGGGFALMCEAVSLSGMLEIPAVIHLGQRPGPATGLPTRTEQADLELALYSGHGEFPRAIFAPGTLDELFCIMRDAFDCADKFQIPVFILTDEFLLDSTFMIEPFDDCAPRINHAIMETTAGYKRYALSESGISPRGIPGKGKGIVRVDSDEHTEEGLITEDSDVRTAMVEKRLRKLSSIAAESRAPRFEGNPECKNLVLCWGSTYFAAAEAIRRSSRTDIALMHLAQVYPLHKSIEARLRQFKKILLVEGNATGQLGKLIRQETGILISNKILKYDGAPFAADVLALQIEKAFA
jgi:2-oxoglutarate/2-oxoacid ferredoxin oxidoreductase subunit alpha